MQLGGVLVGFISLIGFTESITDGNLSFSAQNPFVLGKPKNVVESLVGRQFTPPLPPGYVESPEITRSKEAGDWPAPGRLKRIAAALTKLLNSSTNQPLYSGPRSCERDNNQAADNVVTLLGQNGLMSKHGSVWRN